MPPQRWLNKTYFPALSQSAGGNEMTASRRKGDFFPSAGGRFLFFGGRERPLAPLFFLVWGWVGTFFLMAFIALLFLYLK